MYVCMMNEPMSNELEAIGREIKLWGLMAHYIPTSQYVWGSSILISQFITFEESDSMTVVDLLSACVKIVFRNGTTIYLFQSGHTSHMQWVMECFHAHLKDAGGTERCVFPLALALNQWNGCPNLVSISAEPTAADLRLTFDFQNESVSGTFGKEEFAMEMIEWTGCKLDDLPLVDPWGQVADMDEGVDFDAAWRRSFDESS